MENAITTFLDAIIPKLDDMLKDMRLWIGIAMLVGPIFVICKGVFYILLAPKEANHRLGYRTYFGMGSVPAWRFTQRFAGIVWGSMGLIFGIAALVTVNQLSDIPMEAMTTALNMVIAEAIGAVVAVLSIEITVLVRYDMNGNVRWRKRKKKAPVNRVSQQ